jgi:hypothetical protein
MLAHEFSPLSPHSFGRKHVRERNFHHVTQICPQPANLSPRTFARSPRTSAREPQPAFRI